MGRVATLGLSRGRGVAVRLALGLAALVWFLVRVVPKPSRAAYPCQRAAFPLASAFVLWLAGVVAGGALFRGTVSRWKLTGVARAGWGLLLASCGAAWGAWETSVTAFSSNQCPRTGTGSRWAASGGMR